jgi:hypothetical protein
MPVGDILQVTFVCRFSEQIGLNVRHFRIATVVGVEQTHAQIAEDFRVRVRLSLIQILSNQATFEGVIVSKIFPLPKSIPVATVAAGEAGLVTGDPLPRQVAGLIRARSMFAGRSERGRAYIPFPAETDSGSAATPTLGYATNLGQIAPVYFGPAGIGANPPLTTLTPIIWHRETNTFSVITAIAVSTAWATQRRRGTFGRPNPVLTSGAFIPIG